MNTGVFATKAEVDEIAEMVSNNHEFITQEKPQEPIKESGPKRCTCCGELACVCDDKGFVNCVEDRDRDAIIDLIAERRNLAKQVYDTHILIAALIQSLGGTVTLTNSDIVNIPKDILIERVEKVDGVIYRTRQPDKPIQNIAAKAIEFVE